MGRHTWTRAGRKWRNAEKERLEEEAREFQRKAWQTKWDARIPLDDPEPEHEEEELDN